MAKDIFTAEWFPYYFERFEGSDRVAAMSLAEEGAYHRAIRLAWKYGSVPSDPKILAAKIQKRCTEKVAAVVLGAFVPMPGHPSRMIHPILEDIRKTQEQKYLRYKAGGEATAAKRWGNKEKDSPAIAQQKPSSSVGVADRDREEDREKEKKREETHKAASRTKGSRISEPFLLTAEMRTYAATKRPEVDVGLETEKFCNYWRAKPGREGTKLDWIATWKNWILNARTNGTTNRNQQQTRATSVDRLHEHRAIADQYLTEAELGNIA